MRRVIALELVGLEKLDCDLYDENGNIVYEKGTPFTQDLLMKLSHAKVYKRDEQEISVETPLKTKKPAIDPHAKIRVENGRPLPPAPEPENLPENAEYKTVIEEDKARHLINSACEILASIEAGESPDTKLCLETTRAILKEVYDKCDKVVNISNLRVNDYYTFTHSINTAVLSAIIGREMGYHENKVKDLTMAALLHDIGKMHIPKEILYKPGSLTPEEYSLVKDHSVIGYNFIINEIKLPDYIARGALEHHERWNGDGYPNKLKGREISEFGQIIGIADVFDSLVSEKVYRSSVKSNDAVRIMLTEEAKSFNPDIFHKFAYLAVVKAVKPV